MANEIANGNGKTSDLVAAAKERAGELKDAAMDRAAHLKETATEQMGRVKDAAMTKGRSALEMAQQTIDERPLAVLGGVFAGGLLLGLLLARR